MADPTKTARTTRKSFIIFHQEEPCLFRKRDFVNTGDMYVGYELKNKHK